MRTIGLTAAVVMGMGLLGGRADAADPHIDDLAFTLRNQAAQACKEARYHFRNTPQFDGLYRDLYEMYTLADHIHDIAHDGYTAWDYQHIAEDAQDLDALFHQIEECVAGMGPTVSYGRHGYHGHRPGSNFHLRRLKGVLADMEDTLHHLLDDVTAVGPPAPVVPANPVPTYPSGPAFPPSVGQTYYYEAQPVYPSRPVRRPVYQYQTGKGRFSIVIGGQIR